MQPTTMDLGFKNDCCKNEYNLQWVSGDLIEWEEVICKKCKLGYVVPIYITREYENAEKAFEQVALMNPNIKKTFKWLYDIQKIAGNKKKEDYYVR